MSPLVEVEATVLARAKELTLDLDQPPARARLRTLIEDAVAGWNRDHAHGLRPFELADPDTVVERAERNLAGYGPLAPLLVKRHRGTCGCTSPTRMWGGAGT